MSTVLKSKESESVQIPDEVFYRGVFVNIVLVP